MHSFSSKLGQKDEGVDEEVESKDKGAIGGGTYGGGLRDREGSGELSDHDQKGGREGLGKLAGRGGMDQQP